MNDSFGDFSHTQIAAPGAASSEQKPEGFAPILLKQVLESPEGNFQMFGMTFGMVVATTIVRSIDTSSTKITYTLEDHSGRIDAHYWLEEGDTLNAPDVMLNNYVQVYGSVRSQGGQKTLMIFKMIPVTDPNILVTHILEVLNARYRSEEFSKGNDSGSNAPISFGAPSATNHLGLEGKQLAVFQAIKGFSGEEGISRDELRKRFSHISKEELNSILDFMSFEGHIYSSTDADHFVSTE